MAREQVGFAGFSLYSRPSASIRGSDLSSIDSFKVVDGAIFLHFGFTV
jgi:hypothetical protein